eukprot:1525150-Amphidinium_carterae.1
MWKAAAFTMSRWLTVGVSCRKLVLAASSGLLNLIEFLRSNHLVTSWQSSGLARLTPKILKCPTALGIAAYVPETLVERAWYESNTSSGTHASTGSP